MKKYKDISVKELQNILNSELVDKPKLYDLYKSKFESGYTMDAILSSNKFRHNIDLLNILLVKDKKYTIKEVEELIKKFKTRKVVNK